MKRLGSILLCGLLVPLITCPASADTKDTSAATSCPRSKRDSITWKVTHGPDFWVCYGTLEGDKEPFVGTYYGWAASFKLTPGAPREPGAIEGIPVEWQVSVRSDGTHVRETIFLLKTKGQSGAMQVHVWLMGSSEPAVARAKAAARFLEF